MHRTKERISVNKKVKIMVNTRNLCKSKNIVETTNFGQISKYWQKVELYRIFGENIWILIKMEIMAKNRNFNQNQNFTHILIFTLVKNVNIIMLSKIEI